MGSARGAGLKFVQWIFRLIQFICSIVVLGIYAYFLATLISHNQEVGNWIKAVLGMSVVATIYTLLGIILVCCLSGHPFTSLIAMILDGTFVAAFIYIAVANRDGAKSCSGIDLDTVYGTGNEGVSPSLGDGAAPVPTYGFACRMETACFGASIVAA
jgi:hypothetical protein